MAAKELPGSITPAASREQLRGCWKKPNKWSYLQWWHSSAACIIVCLPERRCAARDRSGCARQYGRLVTLPTPPKPLQKKLSAFLMEEVIAIASKSGRAIA
jgi:hypothetical protein